VSRFREKQYQLAAQKNNEAFRKYDYYQQAARYFERECRIAKHYDSWNYKNIDPKGELEKARKRERLLVRRNKLRNLLKEEEKTYRRELEERNKPRSRPEEKSLEVLKQKLKERRAEQSLYLPKTCRRFQSYFVCPTDSTSPRWNTLKGTNLQSPRVCRDSTNLIHQNRPNSYPRNFEMSENDTKHTNDDDFQSPEIHSRNTSAYFARRSLQNTNVRHEGREEYDSYREHRTSPTFSAPTGRHENVVHANNKENTKEDSNPSSCLDEVTVKLGSCSMHDRIDSQENNHQQDIEIDHPEISGDEADTPHAETFAESSARHEKDKWDRYTVQEDEARIGVNRKDNRQFEVEKTMPWLRMVPGDKNLSKQMFLYLTHNELKNNIEDLAKREQHACNKQSWDEALRLRDMRNRLELIREKQVYNIENLQMDEEVRKMGLLNIGKREAELTARESVCMDSTMYSEEAKEIWQKWLHEDDRSGIKDARHQREALMNNLEKEWKDLAIRDKERITHTYQHVMKDSTLQDEHKLAAGIYQSKMKSFPTSLK
ncbi:hypothetical protein WN55_03344, partial [Dufourea novaeangliae]